MLDLGELWPFVALHCVMLYNCVVMSMNKCHLKAHVYAIQHMQLQLVLDFHHYA